MVRYDNWFIKGVPYVLVLVFAAAFLYFGNQMATEGMVVNDDEPASTYNARVVGVVNVTDHYSHFDEWQIFTFEAEITTRGQRRGEIVTFTQNTRGFFQERFVRVAEEGDRIMLMVSHAGAWSFVDYVRIYNVALLGLAFILLLVLFCRAKGFNSVLSLLLTGLAVFAVFIPSVLSGRDIYFWSIVVCIYAIIVTLFVINGVNRKSIAAVLGCLGGVLAAGLITFFMSRTMELTGITQSESRVLLNLIPDSPIDLIAIIFAGIIIGAVGAIMDIAVSIASALWELRIQLPDAPFRTIFKSGITIGKDILGSSINTLVLAYIGSSLTMVLFLLSHFNSVSRILNRELVLVELLQAIIGGFGIFLTMPLTAFFCALLFAKKRQNVTSDTSPL
ncbi:MAG: YibE/F family protein [Defluviitaleaceae bacterium]|nr:YibE/F family protein [Defluviitaleaceae bacterium]